MSLPIFWQWLQNFGNSQAYPNLDFLKLEESLKYNRKFKIIYWMFTTHGGKFANDFLLK